MFICFSCKTNSSFLLVSLKKIYKNKKIGFYILSTHFLNKNPSYVLANQDLHVVALLLVLIASIMSSFVSRFG